MRRQRGGKKDAAVGASRQVWQRTKEEIYGCEIKLISVKEEVAEV